MNFYKHHLGDYAAATSHLSWDEDCAYRRLLDAYYKREAPLPAEVRDACRLVRATSTVQRRAVDAVLHEFFRLQADGWHQKRCDEEIGAASAQADTNRRIAEKREADKRARTEHESLSRRTNESLHGSSTPPSGEREPSQTPDSRLHKKTPPTPKGDGRFPEFWQAWPKSPRKGSKPDVLKVWQAKDLDREADAILGHVRQLAGTEGWTKQGGEYVPAPVVYLRSRRWDGAEGLPQAPNRSGPPATDWRSTRDGVQSRAYQLGLGPYEEVVEGRGQSWHAYRTRVIAADEAAKEPAP